MTNNINLIENTTLNRKSSFDDDINNFMYDQYDKLIYLQNNYYKKLIKGIHIDSGNRDINYFISPFNFNVYISSNYNYVEPRIQVKLPNIRTINLTKAIIPLYTLIIRNNISINADIQIIGNYFIANINILLIDTTYMIPNIDISNIDSIYTSPQNGIITIVSINDDYSKINFIINFYTAHVFSFIFVSNVLTTVYMYYVNANYNAKKERVLNLNIKELNDDHEHTTAITTSIISTFKLYPKSLKNRYLHANTSNIKKIFEQQPRSLNKLSILLTDASGNEIKLNYLDKDVYTKSTSCYCSIEQIKYSCPCNYILHPYNRYYQLTLFFKFEYSNLVYQSELNLY